MPNVETEAYDRMRSASGVTSLCPASRIKPLGDWQNLARPYIVHFPVALRQARSHEGLEGRLWESYQVSIIADEQDDAALTLVNAVIAALDGVNSGGANFQFQGRRTLRDPEVNVINFVLEFLCGEHL